MYNPTHHATAISYTPPSLPPHSSHTQSGVTLDPMVRWKAHTGEILSIEHVPHETQPLVLSASGDCTVRLWTMQGHYIGMFGQVKMRWYAN